ncbi:efflux RND transporter periplasmic adaptor subunit [Paenibacillus thalictri]|uniref:Efflux RND transporter periplasmic adaptor subunit n=1 Tax=Paenibacillus thalictri TaxID=2527873 RepID=A0A4Q9DWA1_9BACL|nr:efflux RND transporter periplasmic adaptor subunit [Paenibacillus thalictri]TBL79998.1 efflux RND transporter periplasmic adaptor subunit [Paenibacillus thalictri]
MSNKKSKLWIPAVLMLSLTSIVSGCASGTSNATGAADVPVKVIKLGQIADSGLSGKINPDQEVKITSKISGKVAGIQVDEGAKVKKGDVLLTLETDDLIQQAKQAESALTSAKAKLADTQAGARPQELQAAESAVNAAQGAYEQAGASVEQANAAFNLATSTYNRLRNNYDSNASVSKEDLDRGTLDYEKARTAVGQAEAAQKAAAAQVEAAKSKLDLTRAGATDNTIVALQAEVDRLTAALELSNNALNNATISSPTDGIVVKRSIQPGELAQAGVALFSVVNMNQVQIELSVADSQIGSVKTGTPVDVKVPNVPGKSFAGNITYVSPVSNANSNTFPVKVTVDNKDGLLFAGMVAQVYTKETVQGKLEVPQSALIKKDDKQFVVQVDNGTAHLIEVKTTEKNKDWVYVEPNASLKTGQQIAVNPNSGITDGTKLKTE